MSDRSSWKWLGYPGHFIGADKCVFHLTTVVNDKYMISTVGDYRPDGNAKTTLGIDRYFETMVFKVSIDFLGKLSVSSWKELDLEGYQTAEKAQEGHYEMCEKWDKED